MQSSFRTLGVQNSKINWPTHITGCAELICTPDEQLAFPNTDLAHDDVAPWLRRVPRLQNKCNSRSRSHLIVHLGRMLQNEAFLPLGPLCRLSRFRAHLYHNTLSSKSRHNSGKQRRKGCYGISYLLYLILLETKPLGLDGISRQN